jgi:hydroxymethylbilane synthase
VAAFAEREGQELRLRALLAEPDGTNLRRADQRCAWPADDAGASDFGRHVGAQLK